MRLLRLPARMRTIRDPAHRAQTGRSAGTAQMAAREAMKPPADADVRARIRGDLDTTPIVEAAAGTGKTTALVSRIVSLVASGRSQLANLVAVTFTDKAAGELKL